MRFKIKPIKRLFTRRSDIISRILSDLKGLKHEEVVYEVVETILRLLIRDKAKRGKLGLKGLDGIDFRAGRYTENEPGKDIWIKVMYPIQELIDIEVKSSETGVESHKKRHKTSVIIVKDIKKESSLIKIAKRAYNIIFERIRQRMKETNKP